MDSEDSAPHESIEPACEGVVLVNEARATAGQGEKNPILRGRNVSK